MFPSKSILAWGDWFYWMQTRGENHDGPVTCHPRGPVIEEGRLEWQDMEWHVEWGQWKVGWQRQHVWGAQDVWGGAQAPGRFHSHLRCSASLLGKTVSAEKRMPVQWGGFLHIKSSLRKLPIMLTKCCWDTLLSEKKLSCSQLFYRYGSCPFQQDIPSKTLSELQILPAYTPRMCMCMHTPGTCSGTCLW